MNPTRTSLTRVSTVFSWIALLCAAVCAAPTANSPDAGPAKAAVEQLAKSQSPFIENNTQRADLSSQVAKAGADYQGDGLAVTATTEGARLRCVFQKLDGEATREGLWLTSTVSNGVNDRFRVVAAAVGHSGLRQSSAALAAHPSCSKRQSIAAVQSARALPRTGTVEVTGNLVRFVRPGLVEEYSVSMDGVRQDFVVTEKPGSSGRKSAQTEIPRGTMPKELSRLTSAATDEGVLRLELAVTGAKVEPSTEGVHRVRYAGQAVDHERGNRLSHGARLVLENSGRKIAYSRLRVTDATGKELAVRMEVVSGILPDVEGVHPAARTVPVDFLRASLPERPESAGLEAPALRQAGMPAATSLVVLVDDAQAVYPIRIDPTFSDANWISMGGIPGANGDVYPMVADGSGNLYVGGNFSAMGDVIANGIAKWNGSAWSSLGSGMNGYVWALAIAGSNLYAGGKFTMAGGVSANCIAKWDGTCWSSLNSGVSGPEGFPYYGGKVFALAVSGSNLYAGGYFTTAGGNAATNIARWDGSSWSALGAGVDDGVLALAVSGSDMYVGGGFITAGGSPASYIAKWNGNSWSTAGLGMNDPVSALAVSGAGLFVGGDFTTATNGSGEAVTVNRIAKWDGSTWSALGAGMNGRVYGLAVSDNDLYAGGDFTTANNNSGAAVNVNRIARWNGNTWSALGSGTDYRVYRLTISGNDVYAGGGFETAGGSAASHIAKWNGSAWSALSSGLNDQVLALAVSGSEVYAGGFITAFNYIAKWDGNAWSALGSGMNGSVWALAIAGSNLYAGGSFTTAGWSAASNIARWNGISWSALGSGMNGGVWALAVSGSNVYVGGGFTTAGGNPANFIAKWDGGVWSPLGSGLNSYVKALAVSGGDLYAGGFFTMAGGRPANNIAKWNGSDWSPLASPLNDVVESLAASGGDVYVGGAFTTVGGAPYYIAQWNGSAWSTLGSGVNGTVLALAVSDGDLYAGGHFTTAGGRPANYLAKWNGSGWSDLGSGMNSFVSVLAVSGSDLYAGGYFTKAGGKVSGYVARAVLGDAPGYNQLTGTPLSGGEMQFSYIGYPATNYALDRTFNLTPPISWVGQETNTMTVSGVLQFTNTPLPGTNNFWRVRSVP